MLACCGVCTCAQLTRHNTRAYCPQTVCRRSREDAPLQTRPAAPRPQTSYCSRDKRNERVQTRKRRTHLIKKRHFVRQGASLKHTLYLQSCNMTPSTGTRASMLLGQARQEGARSALGQRGRVLACCGVCTCAQLTRHNTRAYCPRTVCRRSREDAPLRTCPAAPQQHAYTHTHTQHMSITFIHLKTC